MPVYQITTIEEFFNTQPLARLQESFHAYRLRHRLTWFEIARAAGVPCLVVWSIDHGLTVHPTHADLVRRGLKQLTGIDFVGCIWTGEKQW